MRTISLVFGMLCLLCADVFGQSCVGSAHVQSSCGGSASVRATPVRNLIAARPVRTAVGGILQKISSARASVACSGSAATQSSCSGSAAVQSSCGGSMSVPVMTAPQAICSDCGGVKAATGCSVQESQQHFDNTTTRYITTTVASAGDEAYQRAYASAAYRAQNGIKGHVSGELAPGRASSAGVGFSTNNPNPMTCLGVPGRTNATCAVVQGPDGWYSTCVK